MGRVIQRVNTSKDNAIFITDFDELTNELSFRTTHDPKQLHTETIVAVGSDIKTNLYFFNVAFLNKFIEENDG